LKAILTITALVVAGLLTNSAPAFADSGPPSADTEASAGAGAVSPAVSPVGETTAPAAAENPVPAVPGLDLTPSAPPAQPADKPMVKQWWFWTALGAAVAASVLIVVLADRGPSAPHTTLGNREFQP
jgi:hypothetical protein